LEGNPSRQKSGNDEMPKEEEFKLLLLSFVYSSLELGRKGKTKFVTSTQSQIFHIIQ
jgi:hypothetical protein